MAAPSITDYYLVADVYCTRPTRITDSRFTLQSATGPVSPGPVNIQVHCDDSTSTGGGPNGTAPPPGTYQVGVELTLKDGSKVALSLGRLFVDTSGERHLVP